MTYTYRQADDNEFWLEDTRGIVVLEPVIKMSFYNTDNKPSAENHAKIVQRMAASDELLEALQTFIDVHAIGGFVEPDKDVIDQAKAAIEKATS